MITKNISLQLYDINNDFKSLIEDEDNINPETGELTEDAIKKLDELGLQKQDLIHYVGLSYHIYNAETSEVDAEIDRLTKIKKQRLNKVNAMKKLIEKNIRLGEEMKFANLEIKWKKNPPKTEIDEVAFDLLSFEKVYPELVERNPVLKSGTKNLFKEWYKENKPLPQGIKIIQNHSLVIK